MPHQALVAWTSVCAESSVLGPLAAPALSWSEAPVVNEIPSTMIPRNLCLLRIFTDFRPSRRTKDVVMARVRGN